MARYDHAFVRAILFDFNGILLDDEFLHFESLRRVLQEEAIDLPEADYWREYVGYDDATAFRTALAGAGRTAEAVLLMRLGARKASYYQEATRERGYRFFPGALELVRAAAATDVTLGVVSGALRSEIEPALRQGQALDLFKTVVSAEDVRESKPSPEGYRLGMKELNSRPPLPERLYHPHEVLAIEDTAAGLEAASAAGLRTLGVAHTYAVEQLEGAELVTESLEEVSLAWLRERLG